ncbi:MAG: hypothetical protein Q4P72_06960, partial [Eubacteriales bacterium]|nr:hypothetical protein [Eubacteriales bacterium]
MSSASASPSSREHAIMLELQELLKDESIVVEDVKIVRAGKHSKIVVIIDKDKGPGGVDTDLLGKITQDISDWCDDNDPLNG